MSFQIYRILYKIKIIIMVNFHIYFKKKILINSIEAIHNNVIKKE